jgi:transposase InsO family protein
MVEEEPHRHFGETQPGRIHLMHIRTGAPCIRIDEHGVAGLLTPAGWDELVLQGKLRVIEPPSRISARQIARMTDWDYRDIVGDPGRTRVAGEELPLDPAAAKMFAEVLLMDEHGIPNGIVAMRKAFAEHWPGELEDRFGPHDKPETVKRWRSERGTPGNRLLVDFVRMWGRVPRRSRSNGIPEEIIQKSCLRARTEPGTVREIEDEISTLVAQINAGEHPDYDKPDEPYPIPNYHRVYRTWTALENAFTVAARDGNAVVLADWRGAGRPLIAKRPFQFGIIDHTRIPAIVVVDLDHDVLYEEVWLTTLFDVCSRVALGRVLTAFPPSLWTVAEVIRRANLPKRPPPSMAKEYPILRRLCGRSAELIVDNGREFRGHGLENAAGQAGFGVRFAPIGKPTYKAVGERYFRTIKAKVAKRAPGRTIPMPKSIKTEYDPRLNACLLIDDVEAILNQAEAEYHTEIHDALGMQPALFFQKRTGGVIEVAHDLGAFFNELMEVKLDVQVDRAGVTLWGMRYHHSERVADLLDDLVAVEPKRQRRSDGTATATTKVKFNRMDIGRIHVWNRVTRKYVVLECEYAEYTAGLPLELHLQIQRQAAEEAAAFNTEADRMAARSRRIQAIRAIDRSAEPDQRAELAKLMEIPRLRQIVGNIVETSIEPAYPVTIGDFIPHDVAATTSLDDEILAPRKPIDKEAGRKARRVPARDRRDAGAPRTRTDPAATVAGPAAQSSQQTGGGSRRIAGDYK